MAGLHHLGERLTRAGTPPQGQHHSKDQADGTLQGDKAGATPGLETKVRARPAIRVVMLSLQIAGDGEGLYLTPAA